MSAGRAKEEDFTEHSKALETSEGLQIVEEQEDLVASLGAVKTI